MIRRRLLAMAPPMLVVARIAADAAPPPTPANPDAPLLALCSEFHRQHALGYDDANPAWEAAMDARYDLYQEIEGILPVTPMGHAAKVNIAVMLLAENHYDVECGDPDARFALATLRGLAGRAAA